MYASTIFLRRSRDLCGRRSSREENGSWILRVRLPQSLRALVWKKGSIALNGVSLTVNEIDQDDVVEVCLIPETQKRTNLTEFRIGQSLTVEVDQWARAVNRANEMSVREIVRMSDEALQ